MLNLNTDIYSYGAEILTLQKVNQKYLERAEMCCTGRVQKIFWSDRVLNVEVSHRVQEDTNVLHTIKRRKSKGVSSHISRRNRFPKHAIQGKVENGEGRERGREELLNEFTGTRGCWKFEEEALDRILRGLLNE